MQTETISIAGMHCAAFLYNYGSNAAVQGLPFWTPIHHTIALRLKRFKA